MSLRDKLLKSFQRVRQTVSPRIVSPVPSRQVKYNPTFMQRFASSRMGNFISNPQTYRNPKGQTWAEYKASVPSFAEQLRTPIPGISNIPGVTNIQQASSNTGALVEGYVTDTAQGAYRIATGLRDRKPLQVAGGAAGMVFGGGKALAAGSPIFQGANLVASGPQIGTSDIARRAGAGFIQMMAMTPELAQNVPDKNVNFNVLGQDVSFDPVKSAGGMYGFIKNPVNNRLFQMTEKYMPAGKLLQKGNLRKWLSITAARGGVEDIFIGMANVPDNASNKEKLEYMAQNFGTGVGSEIFMRGGLEAGGTGFKKAGADKLAIKAFDELKEVFRKLNRPVYDTNNFNPKTGRYETIPMWKRELKRKIKDQTGAVKLDEFIPGKKPKVADGSLYDVSKYKTQLDFAKKYDTPDKFIAAVSVGGSEVSYGSAAKSKMITAIDKEFGSLENFWRVSVGKTPKVSSSKLGLNSQPFIKSKPNVAQPPISDIKVKDQPGVPQIKKIQKPQPQAPAKRELVSQQDQKIVGLGTDNLPSETYSFNINRKRLKLQYKDEKKLNDVVEMMRPVLQKRRGKSLTNKEIIEGGRKAKLLDTVLSRKEASGFSEKLQASRNFLKTESKKTGVSPKYLSQLEIVSSNAADAGRKLRAFSVQAEDSGLKEAVLKDLRSLNIESKRLVDASKNVDWDNAKQVTEFYRKFKPASFLNKLEEYRYTNMLSSPNTHIINTFSNFIQSGIVKPVEKTITGSLDWAKSALTGSERQYYTSQGVDYTKGYWKSLPDAMRKFRSVITGEGGLLKPDVDYLPTGTGKLHKIYTTPLRALEASDQFFRTMIEGGEISSLKKAGIEGAGVKLIAKNSAQYTLFRQQFDPQGKLGQGGVLKLWDKWNAGVASLRRLPGGRWIVPFLQTPTNILKQGVEYSPLGAATIPGSKEPLVQLSKTIIGTGVFMGAYSMAEAGLTTWDTPIDKKEKDAFYASGLQPYSVKIGNKWVSYSKLGPLSYPIAMASAMKWAFDNGADENKLTIAGAGAAGFLQFFADQSYVRGVGDIIDAIRGDEYKQGRALTNIPAQLVPYRSFLAWITRLVDPVYRKSSGGTIPEQMYKSLASQIPGASTRLEPYKTPLGELSDRQFPVTNAFSPLRISQERTKYLNILQGRRDKLKENKAIRNAKRDIEDNTSQTKTVGEKYIYYDEETGSVKTATGDNAIKARMKQEELPDVYKKDNTYFYKDDDGSVSTIKLEKPKRPALVGSKNFDKELLSTYKGKLSTYQNNIRKLYEIGVISQEDAIKFIDGIQAEVKATTRSGGSGKGKKFISDAQLLSAYKKLLETVYAPKKATESRLTTQQIAGAPIQLQRQPIRRLY